MISDIETARRQPSLRTLLKVASALEVPVASLFLDPESKIQDRVAVRALVVGANELDAVAKLLDVTPAGRSV